MLVKRRTFPIPRFPAPFVNLLSESHEFSKFWRSGSVHLKSKEESDGFRVGCRFRSLEELGFSRILGLSLTDNLKAGLGRM